jgi:VWFA-related protein
MFELRAERNVVVVGVVVRDSTGRVLGNLGKDDFTLLDNGKPQVISEFSVEQLSAPAVATQAAAEKAPKPVAGVEAPTVSAAPWPVSRQVALYFDDLHMSIRDVGQSRAAADRYFVSALGPQDRVAIFTSSGIGELEFTEDRPKLHEALFRLRARSKTLPTANTCPEIGEYQAYLMTQLQDPTANKVAAGEATNCDCGSSNTIKGPDILSNSGVAPAPGRESGSSAECEAGAVRRASFEAWQVWQLSDLQSKDALARLADVVRRLGAMPGQRNLVLVSSGFLAATHQLEVEKIIDGALRSSVVMNALDAKGLYTYAPREGNPIPYVLTPTPDLGAKKSTIEQLGLTVAREVLGTLAAATGGTFFTNSNDLDEGFRTVGALPEAYYVLTFSPQDLKPDGAFHRLKVLVNSREAVTIQARRGYLAPGQPFPSGQAGEARSQASAEIENAIFSQEESHGLPVEVRTEYAKLNEHEATLTVLIHLDLGRLRFRKEKGRNVNALTFATAVFDPGGQYVAGNGRVLEFHLKDKTLARLARPGFTAGTKLTVRPGAYRLREVVRDAEAGQISALNRAVEIPF